MSSTEIRVVPLPRSSSLLGVVAAACLLGTVGVFVKLIYEVAATNALVIGFLRLAIAGPALAAVSRVTSGRNPFHVRRRDLPIILIMSAGTAAVQVAQFAAIPFLGVTRTALLATCMGPLFIAVFAALTLHERPSLRALPPMALALLGTALLIGGGHVEEGAIPAVGVALALSAAAAGAIFPATGRALANHYPAMQTIAVAFTLGAIALSPFAIVGGLTRFPFGGRGGLLVVLLGLLPTAGAYGLLLRGLRDVPAVTAGILSLLDPLIATLLATALFAERLRGVEFIGAALLLVGLVWLVSASTPRTTSQR